MNNRIAKRLLLGLGFDSNDGHVRITKGKNFRLYGGSKETHELMQEKAVKFNEQLERKNKRLDDIDTKEFYDIAKKVGLKVPKTYKKNNKGGEY
ncbi:MAG: hypothetical protein HQ579_00180 [Candidatus Omnitrophica bacterium]|nr:hypothetical protein [Candidatus Omnitrophota bacterium]